MLPNDGHRVVSQEWWSTRHHLVQHGPQGVQVCPGGHLTAHGLLRGHVGHGAHHHPFGSQPRAVDGHGQAEVADLGHAITFQPDVARFQVPVDDAPPVGKLQAPAGLPGDAQRLLQWHPVVCGVLYRTPHVASPMSSVTM